MRKIASSIHTSQLLMDTLLCYYHLLHKSFAVSSFFPSLMKGMQLNRSCVVAIVEKEEAIYIHF